MLDYLHCITLKLLFVGPSIDAKKVPQLFIRLDAASFPSSNMFAKTLTKLRL